MSRPVDQAQLRCELTSRLGVGWKPVVKGLAEIDGVPDEALRAFSTRRAQVVEHLAEQAASGWRAAQVAAVATRDAKQTPDLDALRGEWAARAAEHGFGDAERAAVLGRIRWQMPDAYERFAAAQRLFADDGMTATRAAFSDADLVTAWAAELPQGAPATAVRKLAAGFADDRRLLPLDADEPPVGVPCRYTTRQLADVEHDAVALALDARDTDAPQVPAEIVAAVINERHSHLTNEQRSMVTAAAGSVDGVVCVVGHAGAGKTTSLRALHDALATHAITTLGAAPSGVAAEALERETAIPSTTLHRLVGRADRHGLPRASVIVVDEAAMADTRTLHRLLQHASRAEAKVVLVGDPAQLGAVGPGGLHAALVERLGASHLTTNHRQHDPAERGALEALRSGSADEYLEFAAKQGRLTLVESPDHARAALLADWHAAIRDDPRAVMLAYRRVDVDVLNRAARTLLRRDQRLGDDRHTTPAGAGFAIGDSVLCLHNQPSLSVSNGTRGVLVGINDDRLLLRTSYGDRTLPPPPTTSTAAT